MTQELPKLLLIITGSTGTDKIDIASVGSYVEADGAGNANLAFITDADASLPLRPLIYTQVDFKGEGNTLVVIDENKVVL